MLKAKGEYLDLLFSKEALIKEGSVGPIMSSIMDECRNYVGKVHREVLKSNAKRSFEVEFARIMKKNKTFIRQMNTFES